MFDKITIQNNRIKLNRHTVEYKLNEKDITTEVVDLQAVVDFLTKHDIKYKTTEITIPKEFEKFDGLEWRYGRNAAIKMINGDSASRISELKELLNRYDKKVMQHDRSVRMGVACKHNIEELDRQAEQWVAEIKRLEA